MLKTTEQLSTSRSSTFARAALIVVPVLVLAFGPLAACNAVKGAGKDLEETSDNTKEAVRDIGD